jgi:predicted enzyme related to lactoylglutathione lyase
LDGFPCAADGEPLDELRHRDERSQLESLWSWEAERRSRREDRMNLTGILLGSEDPDRLAEYYTSLFGKPGFEGDGYRGWQLGGGWLTVGPHDQVKGKNTQPGRVIWNLETPDVDGEFERLRAAGATVVREPYAPGGSVEMRIATLADPDDNYFQLMSPMGPAEG